MHTDIYSRSRSDTGVTGAEVIDFRNSYILTAGPKNAVRFAPESRCTIFDDATDSVHEFIQCAACKSEYTFSPKSIFTENNYNFTPVFGTDMTTVIFSEYILHNDLYRRVGDMSDGPLTVWGRPTFHLHGSDDCEVLEDVPGLLAAVRAGKYIVVQTEFAAGDGRFRAVLEYPAKTVNMNAAESAIQIDTGPIVYPDLSANDGRVIDSLRLCYLTFNSFGRCEVIVQNAVNAIAYYNPSLYADIGNKSSLLESFVVDHYCDVRRLDATHRVYSLH